MTRKHFIKIAKELKDYQFSDPQDRTNIAYLLAAVFKDINPRFDKDRFLKAVGDIV